MESGLVFGNIRHSFAGELPLLYGGLHVRVGPSQRQLFKNSGERELQAVAPDRKEQEEGPPEEPDQRVPHADALVADQVFVMALELLDEILDELIVRISPVPGADVGPVGIAG